MNVFEVTVGSIKDEEFKDTLFTLGSNKAETKREIGGTIAKAGGRVIRIDDKGPVDKFDVSLLSTTTSAGDDNTDAETTN